MQPQKNVYDHITINNIKTVVLIVSMPAILIAISYFALYFLLANDPSAHQSAMYTLKTTILPLAGIAFVWGGISYFFGDKMMLGFAGAELAPDDKEHQHIFRAVENVAIAAGLPTPKVYLINDKSLNAFATGHSPKTASVALTTGLVEKLEPLELQAVIAHEMGHIGNRDVRLNMIIITGLGVCAMLADLIFRILHSGGNRRSKDSQSNSVLFVVWFVLVIFNFLVAPIIHMAISRTREYAADATAAYITRNPIALASALRKISQDARVEALDGAKNMSHACIFDPTYKAGQTSAFFGWGSTHPPIEKRIERLDQMSGLFS